MSEAMRSVEIQAAPGERAWTNVDKSGWSRGEWLSEPDKLQWVDADTGLDCLIVRGPIGALCGYVAVKPGHPWHGVEYNWCSLATAKPRGVRESDKTEKHTLYSDDPKSYYRRHLITKRECDAEYGMCGHRPDSRIDVHGGLTFSGACQETNDPGRHVCHVSRDGQPVWWFGFDCAHLGDVCPDRGGVRLSFYEDGWYKDIGYVRRECAKLAAQLVAVQR